MTREKRVTENDEGIGGGDRRGKGGRTREQKMDERRVCETGRTEGGEAEGGGK